MNDTVQARKLATPIEMRGYLRVHEMTLYRWMKNGKIPAFKVGGRWRFDWEEVEKWIKSKTTTEQ